MKNLFLWEIKKNVKKGAIIGIGIASVVILILLAVVYNLIADLVKEITSGDFSEVFPDEEMPDDFEFDLEANPLEMSKSELTELRDSTRLTVKELEKEYEKDKRVYSQLYAAKSLLAETEYALKNGIYDGEVRLLGYNYQIGGDGVSGEGFVGLYGPVIALIVIIYGIIYGAAAFTGEYKSGTIKLMMTRPVAKSAVTAAKLLSMYAVLTVMFLVPTLIGYAYGAIAFGSESATQVVYSFNASGAGVTTSGALTFGTIMSNLVNILVLATFSFALATVTRNYAAGLVGALVVALGVGSFFASIGITAFTLSYSFNYMNFFGANEVVRNGNFFISLAVTVFWLAASLASSFIVTKKRDIY